MGGVNTVRRDNISINVLLFPLTLFCHSGEASAVRSESKRLRCELPTLASTVDLLLAVAALAATVAHFFVALKYRNKKVWTLEFVRGKNVFVVIPNKPGTVAVPSTENL